MTKGGFLKKISSIEKRWRIIRKTELEINNGYMKNLYIDFRRDSRAWLPNEILIECSVT